MPPAANPIDAVTAVLMHGGELFLARRQERLSAFPGYHAFPGGKLDPEDATGAPLPAVFEGFEPPAVRGLVRELREELGFDLAQPGAFAQLRLIGRVTTPKGFPARFDTRFFRVDLPHRPAFVLDPAEHDRGQWASPQTWLQRYRAGELLLAPPTLATLESLAAVPVREAIDFDLLEMPGGTPMLQSVHGVRNLLVRSNTLPPARHTNCFLIGDEGAHRVLVDPSPHAPEELERLLQAAQRIGFDEVFLTHHHPDHREYADVIARRCGVPLGMSAATESFIREEAPGFFEGVQLRHYADGDLVTHWLGRPVRALSVPGHDEGQLALMPDDRAWCIVGDLIQGIGTVVIAPPEGNMRRYFATLERIIELAPRVIYPSHGMALGGVHYLQQALAHRLAREAQVMALHEAGASTDQMLAQIYQDVDPFLLPLARINIEGHLQKLREDGRIAA